MHDSLLSDQEFEDISAHYALAPRHRRVLSLWMQRFSVGEIALATCRSEVTIHRYLHEIRVAIGVVGRTDRALIESLRASLAQRASSSSVQP